jgi:hypothetical protein
MMDKNLLIQSAKPDPPVKITPEQKSEWNKFLDFVNEKGFRGNTDLDKKDTNLGKSLIEEYRKLNPESKISYDLIKPIQENVIQDWEMMKKIRAMQGVKAVNADDRQLSPPDGWLGSLTSNGYFPTATTSDDKGRIIKDWGHDLNGYYESLVDHETKKIPMPARYANNKK